jgi:hypothetical protein
MKLFLLIFAFFTPAITFASDPFPGIFSFAGCSGRDCTACNVVYLANEGISWLIGILFVIFAVLVAWRGVQLVTSSGNPGALEAVKESFVNAFIGIIIILAAWLIVDTIMRSLVGQPGEEGNLPIVVDGQVKGWLAWSEVECQVLAVPDFNDVNPYNPGEDTSTVPTIPGPNGVPVPGPGSNCGLNESNLVSIPGQGSHRATAATVSRFTSMQSALAGRGITLTVTSSYRSDARQTELWDACPRCQTQGTVARPCSRGGNGSRHSSGVALDLNSSGSRCDIINACRAAGASFIMTYTGSGHVHCDWGGTQGERLTISCPR